MSLRGNSTAHLFLNPELGEELSDDDLKRLHCQQLADRLTSLEEKVAGVSRLLDDKCKAFTFIKLSDAFLPRTTVFYKERFDRFVACVKSICSLYIAFEAPISVIDSQYPPQIQQLFVIEGEIRNAFSSPLDGKDPLLSTESRITQIMHLVERRNSWLQDESNRQHVKTFYISALLPNAWFIPAELTLCHHLETIVIGGRISFLPKELQKLKGRGVSIFLLMTISPLAVSAGNRYFLLDSLPDCYFR